MRHNMKFLVIDTESGSRKPESTLLSAAFLVYNDNFQLIDSLDLRLKPDTDCLYIVDAQGMAVNKISLVVHDKVAITYKQAKPLLFDFLKKNSLDGHLTPLGHAVKGDINRIVDNIISIGSWEQFCTYHFIDTSVVLQYLRVLGKMPPDCDGSIEALCKYFRINQKAGDDAQFHEALFDAKMTMAVFKKMVELGK